MRCHVDLKVRLPNTILRSTFSNIVVTFAFVCFDSRKVNVIPRITALSFSSLDTADGYYLVISNIIGYDFLR